MKAQNEREEMPEALKGTDIGIIPSHRALLNQQMAPDLAVCIYVAENEAPVFWQYVLPLARSMQHSGNGVSIYSVDTSGETLPDMGAVSILELDAEKLTAVQFKALLRLEGSNLFCSLLRDERRKIVVYLHGIHAAKEDLTSLITLLVDAHFGMPGEPVGRNLANTRIAISGVHAKLRSASGRVMKPSVVNRRSVFAFDC
jgi:hypothetical protein